MEKIPCKNCICLAICRQKMNIECSMLFNWYEANDLSTSQELNDILPNWELIDYPIKGTMYNMSVVKSVVKRKESPI